MSEPPATRGNPVHSPFRIEVAIVPKGAVVGLSGSCSMECAAELTQQLVGLASEPHPVLVLDLSGLDFIESSGLGGIVAAYLRCRRRNADLRLVAPQPNIRRILDLTRLTELFRVFDSVEDALSGRATSDRTPN